MNHTQDPSLSLVSQAGSEYERLLIEESNVAQDVSETLVDLGITQLPIVSKRKRQNFDDIVIDENGDIIAEEEDDEDISFSATYNYRKKRKAEKKINMPSKKNKKSQASNSFKCVLFGNSFSRKDCLIRHKRNHY